MFHSLPIFSHPPKQAHRRGPLRIASAERRVKPPARLLRFATALRVTAPLGCGYPGFWVGFCPFRFHRSAAVCSKSFVFSSLPIRKVLILGFRFPVDFIHSRRRSYYLFFTTCSLLLECRGVSAERLVLCRGVSAEYW